MHWYDPLSLKNSEMKNHGKSGIVRMNLSVTLKISMREVPDKANLPFHLK